MTSSPNTNNSNNGRMQGGISGPLILKLPIRQCSRNGVEEVTRCGTSTEASRNARWVFIGWFGDKGPARFARAREARQVGVALGLLVQGQLGALYTT